MNKYLLGTSAQAHVTNYLFRSTLHIRDKWRFHLDLWMFELILFAIRDYVAIISYELIQTTYILRTVYFPITAAYDGHDILFIISIITYPAYIVYVCWETKLMLSILRIFDPFVFYFILFCFVRVENEINTNMYIR